MEVLRKALTPTVALVVLIAVTLIISLTFITYIYGLWHSVQEEFILRPYLYVTQQTLLNDTSVILELYVVNVGPKSDKIMEIKIIATNGTLTYNKQILIPAGFKGYIRIGDDPSEKWEGTGEIIKGEMYRVIVYTEKHGTMFYDVLAS